jgi:hypothetical protein
MPYLKKIHFRIIIETWLPQAGNEWEILSHKGKVMEM